MKVFVCHSNSFPSVSTFEAKGSFYPPTQKTTGFARGAPSGMLSAVKFTWANQQGQAEDLAVSRECI
jgi:hypothetical protein